jgi:hypothetical protein
MEGNVLVLTKVCTKCNVLKNLSEFPKRNERGEGKLKAHCKKCETDRLKRYAKTEQGKKKSQERNRKYYYGLDNFAYETLYKAQEGKCAICKKDIKLVVDHDHKTGKVRGLLCDWHNRALGLFQDNPEFLEEAAKYLREHV